MSRQAGKKGQQEEDGSQSQRRGRTSSSVRLVLKTRKRSSREWGKTRGKKTSSKKRGKPRSLKGGGEIPGEERGEAAIKQEEDFKHSTLPYNERAKLEEPHVGKSGRIRERGPKSKGALFSDLKTRPTTRSSWSREGRRSSR